MADRLEEIKARLAAATPGPWEESGGTEFGFRIAATERESKRIVRELSIASSHGGNVRAFADAALIAHAPTDLAYLIAEVEWLRRELEWIADRVSGDEPGNLSAFRPGWEAGERAREALAKKTDRG